MRRVVELLHLQPILNQLLQMKKVLAMAAIALFMVSCSDDSSDSTNNGNNGENTVLLKKSIEVVDGETFTSTYTYEGTKLVKVEYGAYSEEYFYTGDLLTSATFNQGSESSQHTYTYNADNTLKTHIELVPNYGGSRYEYTYNSNGTITVTHYVGDLESQTQLNDVSIVTMNNNNIVSVVMDDIDTTTYTFDTKNNPLKNITCFKTFILTELEGGASNILSSTNTYDGEVDYSTVVTHTYNSSNYPLTSTETLTFEDGEMINTAEYFYE